MLDCLPRENAPLTVGESRRHLETQLSEPLFRFVSMEAQASAKEVLASVIKLETGEKPDMRHWDQSEHLTAVRSRFAFFVKASTGDTNVYGEQALNILLDEVKAKLSRKLMVQLSETKVFEAFSFLWSPERLRESTKICFEVLTACNGHMLNTPTGSDGKPAKKAKKNSGAASSSAGNDDRIDKAVLDLFA